MHVTRRPRRQPVRSPWLVALVALCAASSATLRAGPAAAQVPARKEAQPPPPPAPAADEDDDDTRAVAKPAAPDQRAGHILAAARAAVALQRGRIVSGVDPSGILSAGATFGASIGLGISRYVSIDAAGSYALFGGTNRCPDCGARAFDLGLGLTYHLVQGLALDPWIGYGLGFRSSTFTVPEARRASPTLPVADAAYLGLDVARIGIGADFYPLPSFGFGPYIEGDAGTYVSRPDDDRGGAVYATFSFGLRVALDPQRSGRASLRAAPASARRGAPSGPVAD